MPVIFHAHVSDVHSVRLCLTPKGKGVVSEVGAPPLQGPSKETGRGETS